MGISHSSEAPRRACALDALRGLAILGMILSGQLPFGEKALPAWMYADAAVTTTPWLGFARGAIIILLLALSVSFFTKRGCFWRT